MSKTTITCPNCGAQMNHHASKIDYTSEDPTEVDPFFGGIPKEAYACPHCGRAELIKED